jgi:hypothetical protein
MAIAIAYRQGLESRCRGWIDAGRVPVGVVTVIVVILVVFGGD